MPSIEFDKKLTTVFFGHTTFWFSYGDLIAFRRGGHRFVRENPARQTTRKNLNQIDGGNKKERLPGDSFAAVYRYVIEENGELPGSDTPFPALLDFLREKGVLPL